MRLRAILVVGVLFGLTGCPKEEPKVKELTVTVDPAEVLADGNNTVAVTVSGAESGVKVTVRTPKGLWKDYAKDVVEVPGGNGTVTLVTCDSRLDVNCAGNVRITAVGSDDATGTASVKFLPGENCLNGTDDDSDTKVDCADDGCLGRPCTLPSGNGTGECDATGKCVCSAGTVETCTDRVDNNCDGKVDCADTTACATGKVCTLLSGAPGLCASGKCECPKLAAEVCDNEVDDDCDGLLNCADPDCQPKANEFGPVCDALGNTCTPPDGAGASTCTRCGGNGAPPEMPELSCGDLKDNDCNGKLDCQDGACAGVICDKALGKVCNAASRLCECAGNPAVPEANCADLKDDDCDGKVDCLDEDCPVGGDCLIPTAPQASMGAQCTEGGGKRECKCQGNGGTPEANEATCNDSKDNDCDGLVDCDDGLNCGNKACGDPGLGKICGSTTKLCECPQGYQPDRLGVCKCIGGVEEKCDDLIDNNCDSKTDCGDSTCGGKICTMTTGSGKGKCAGGNCVCPGLSAELCNDDGIDDDCDGKVNCEDPDCQPKANELGKVCDAKGNTCSPAGTGISTCTICSGNGANAELNESLCGDAKDNDCDGLADCQDPDCNQKLCDAAKSKFCNSQLRCDCPNVGANNESDFDCNNLKDDDCDGLVDCMDTDCPLNGTCTIPGQDLVGMQCELTPAGARACTCSGNGGAKEPGKELSCGDGADNDCNRLADCKDPACVKKSCGPGGQICNATTLTCACPDGFAEQAGVCVCQAGGSETCDDNADNDCNGKTDCVDTFCANKICTKLDGRKGKCVGIACVCPSTPETPAAGTCNNGMDDDCDLKIDCEDSDCQPANGQPGGICDAKGNTCSPKDANGISYCTVCGGNGGTAETSETFCGDGKDNDCDGEADCLDLNCGGQKCTVTGKTCNASKLCQCPYGKSTESTCNDLIDEDCDGLTDCADADCPANTACKLAGYDSVGMTCSAAKTCTCTGNGGTAEGTKELSCVDTFDNDCDGEADCADSDCAGKSCGTGGKLCNIGSGKCECPAGMVEQAGQCVCQSGTVEICDDGADNNCDGKIDCADTTWCNGKACTLISGLRGACSTGQCRCPGTTNETVCNDGIDNDCDNVADCDDSECQPSGNDLGKLCDAKGFTCSIVTNGRSTCSVCSGNGGTPQMAETLCGDSSDNDCDGLKDCQDPDCANLRCSPYGKFCNGTSKGCECPGGSAESTCDDLEDNDCDGKVDCADSDCGIGADCRLATLPSIGTKCVAGGACACSGNGGVVEAAEATCSDGKDNDCDGLTDCADMNCQPSAPGANDGKYCAAAALGKRCDATGACVCPLGQITESSCGDLKDNDCDGLADCADSNCDGLSCGANGQKCNGTQCLCPSGLSAEDNCMNGGDDDCDGKVDCADENCANRQCNASSPNFQCVGTPSICKDTTASYSLVLTALPGRIPANGLATSVVTAVLRDSNGVAQSNKAVTFGVTAGPGTMAAPSPATTDSTGKISAVYTSGTGIGPATVTASYNTGSSTVTGSVTIDTPGLGQVKFVSRQYTTMGVKYSSYQENNQLVFQVLDVANATYPAGLTVTFEHAPKSGSTLVGETATTCTADKCTTTAKTDAAGYARVNLVSGTVASVVSVLASATAGGLSGNATADNIAIVGAKASGKNLSLACTPRNVPGFASHDCTNSLVNANITCTAYFADRFDNVLGVPTLATLSSEAGAAGLPTQTNAQGAASNYVAVQGFRLPVDVDPDPAQGEWFKAYNSGCGLKTHNPRDGVTTVIVSASGEEGFVDGSNGCPANGVYDGPGSANCTVGPPPAGGDGKGEYFIDIGEPFIDANDNGIRDANESYLDGNNSNSWDGPNGKWDGSTVIWAETRVLYSGLGAVYTDASWTELSRWYDPVESPPTSGPSLVPLFVDLFVPRVTMVPFYFTDQNFNMLSTTTSWELKMLTTSATAVKMINTPARPDGLGMSLTQQLCNTQTGTGCSNSCTAAPCYVVTTVGGFTYGNLGVAEITRGDKNEAWIIRASSTLGGVSTYLDLYGESSCYAAGSGCASNAVCCSNNCDGTTGQCK